MTVYEYPRHRYFATYPTENTIEIEMKFNIEGFPFDEGEFVDAIKDYLNGRGATSITATRESINLTSL